MKFSDEIIREAKEPIELDNIRSSISKMRRAWWLVSEMPDSGLDEMVESLLNMVEFYKEQDQLKANPPPTQIIKTWRAKIVDEAKP